MSAHTQVPFVGYLLWSGPILDLVINYIVWSLNDYHPKVINSRWEIPGVGL